MLKLQPVTSSAIKAIGFDGTNLYVMPVNTDIVYSYADVPRSVYLEFLAAPSKGGYFTARVKPFFSGTRYLSPYDFHQHLSLREMLPGSSYGF